MVEHDTFRSMYEQLSHEVGQVSTVPSDGLVSQYLAGTKPPVQGGGVEVKGKGQIADMKFPPGWSDGYTEPYKGIGFRSYNEVQFGNDPDVTVSFLYRGFPLQDSNQAQAFHDLLQQTPHTLSSTELQSIPEVLRDKANQKDFNMISARTENINGKNVLVVEGRYKEIQQDTYEVFVDADKTGANVQEIFYQAPKAKYFAHLRDAKQAIHSIEWK